MGAEEDQKFDRQRNQLVAALAGRGITDRGVLHAVATTPRHLFMPPDLLEAAYVDKAFPIGQGQTISQPYTVAYQTQLLRISTGDKVLEIGTGSGYQAAILTAMGAIVYTIERQNYSICWANLLTYNNFHIYTAIMAMATKACRR